MVITDILANLEKVSKEASIEEKTLVYLKLDSYITKYQSFSALKKMVALALSSQREILSAARAQFFGSLALSLSLRKKRAPLNFALTFKIFLKTFCA